MDVETDISTEVVFQECYEKMQLPISKIILTRYDCSPFPYNLSSSFSIMIVASSYNILEQLV